MRVDRRIGSVAVAGMVAVGLTGCEPPPPRLQLTVDSTAAGADDDPGDGVCSSAAAGGACTLQAAIDEGNAAPDGADLAVPAGHHRNVVATITGDLRVNHGTPDDVAITESTITVAAGGRIEVTGINTSTTIQAVEPSGGFDQPITFVSLLRLDVAGSALVTRSIVGGLDVAAGGGAVVVDSIVDAEAGMVNHGRLVALRSSLFASGASGSPNAVVLTTRPGARSHLISSVVAVPDERIEPWGFGRRWGKGTCAGSAPTSGSYLFVEVPCGPMEEAGDGSGDAGATTTTTVYQVVFGYRQGSQVHGLRPTSPLVDAVPVGDPACPIGAVDVYGQPRGGDGNGDGTGGCDIGAVERQP